MSSDPVGRAIRAALDVARRAPSVHNTQPWRWALGAGTAELFADRSRQLPVIDPDGRELTLSCGAALHHARIALRALGWDPAVRRLPDTGDPDHLASIALTPRTDPDPAAQTLVAAAARRRTDRRAFLPEPVPDSALAGIRAAVRAEQVEATMLHGSRRQEVIVALAHADTVQRRNPRYADELGDWARRNLTAGHDLPATVPPLPSPFAPDMPGWLFGGGELSGPPPTDDQAVLCVLSTDTDDPVSWLRTGEALSAALLAATTAGLAGCPLSQLNEVKVVHDLVKQVGLHGEGEPHLVLRLGRGVLVEFPDAPAPRRGLDTILGQSY